MLLQTAFEEDISVVLDDIGLAVTIKRYNTAEAHVLNLVCAEKDSLAEKVAQDVIRANELHAPIESV